jgi:hypothetical protein
MAEQEQEEKRLRHDFDKQGRDLKAVLESQRIKKQQALKMKDKLATQNPLSLKLLNLPSWNLKDAADGAEDEQEALVALATLSEAEARLRAELEDKLAELRRKYEEKMRNVLYQPAKSG